MPPQVKPPPTVLPQPSTPSGRKKTTDSKNRVHVPTGPAAGNLSPQHQVNIPSPRAQSQFRAGRSRAPKNPLELVVNVMDIPRCYTTWMVYQMLEQYGKLDYIRIETRRRKAFVVFRPAPQDVSWVGERISATYLDSDGVKRQFQWHASDATRPTTPYTSPEGKVYPQQITLPLPNIDFGTMQTEDLMVIMHSIGGNSDDNASLALDLKKKWIVLTFGISMPEPGQGPAVSRTFKIQLDLAQMHELVVTHGSDGCVSVTFTVDHPPEVYRKTQNIKETHEAPIQGPGDPISDDWNEYNTWYRQTDIDTNPGGRNSPIQLRKTSCVLETGRWLTYRIKFGPRVASSPSFQNFCQALADHNVPTNMQKNINYSHGNLSTSWAWADSLQKSLNPARSDSFLADLLEMADTVHLTFAVHYQLEVCLSLSVLHEGNINVEFLTRLAALDPIRAVKILEKVADRKERIHDPQEIFRLHNQVSVVEKPRPSYCAKIPAATVTPTTIYFSTPVLETSNRVVRNFVQHEDRFLRVKFNDEKHKGALHSHDDRIMDEIFSRVYRAMTHGIIVGGRRYEFLAFGSSQFRDHGAYFFASTDTVSAASIRAWMGDFTQFNNVAKYISRLGLCFTTTRGIPHQVTVQRIDDVKRNGYDFTDGVGKISPLLADMIASHYKFDYRPSVFQFRMAGCKGVLAVDPDLKGMTVQIRPSQEKFPAPYYGLEIAKTSKFTSANLNVQLILVLSALGIPDSVFMDKLRIMLADMERAMTDETTARQLLEKNIDYSQMTLSLSQAIGDGFMQTQEPFIISWLHLWRSWSLKYLKQKQRILVEQGAYVFGITDETGTLRGHFNDGGKTSDDEKKVEKLDTSALSGDRPEVGNGEKPVNFEGAKRNDDGKSDRTDNKKMDDPPTLPEIFIQVPNPDTKGGYTVIEAICILTRSPTLHAGDVRVVRAVNIPALHHLKDCVVLPQTGDRDLANMCSGGDLDGDEYIVSWDPALIPRESVWNQLAMDFSTAKPPPREGPVTVRDMASFFVNHIKNDKLGQIAVAHKCWADSEPDGVQNEKCLELAELHSQAVDYPKTGMPAKFPKRLRLKKRPHWIEPRGADYKSKKVIGQLYNAVKLDNFTPAWELPFDQRILGACVPSQQNLEGAKEIKVLYDEAVRRIMAQYGINSEFEVFTTFVQDHHQEIGDYKFAETMDEVSSNLRTQFIEQCYEKAGTTVKDRDWEKMKPFIVAMYTVTAQEVGDAVADSKQMVERGGRMEPRRILDFDNVPFMSFPWIFGRDLASIAKGRNGASSAALQTAKARPTLPVDKKLAKAQSMAARYGELEPLAEVYMPEGGMLHVGDVMNLHHTKVQTAGAAVEDGRKKSIPSEDIALAFSLISSMEDNLQERSAKEECQDDEQGDMNAAIATAAVDATRKVLSTNDIQPSSSNANAGTHQPAERLELDGNKLVFTSDGDIAPTDETIASSTSQLAAVSLGQMESGTASNLQQLAPMEKAPTSFEPTTPTQTGGGEEVSEVESQVVEEEVEIVFEDTPSSMLLDE